MLEEILRHLNNWFVVDVHDGVFTVDENGSIALPFLQKGQYYRIIGSVFNDGLHRYALTDDLMPETFSGTIWALSIPRSVIELSTEIEAWQKKYQEVTESPYTSESFGGYSYTKSSTSGAESSPVSWQATFKSRLNNWRKIKGVEP